MYKNSSTTLRTFALIGFAIGAFAVITQFVLMLNNRVAPIPETVLRFFSFFTILTNTLVTVYFIVMTLKKPGGFYRWMSRPGFLTAITVYIFIVGLVYQLILRSIWTPEGLQMVVDELLHSVIPVYALVFWYRYEEKSRLKWSMIPKWLIYPGVYLVFILLRGSVSGFYPYPFVHVGEIGLTRVMINAGVLISLFFVTSAFAIGIGKWMKRTSISQGNY